MDENRIQHIRIALGAVGPTPFRAVKAEETLMGEEAGKEVILEAARIASSESFPIDDIRGGKDYRKAMVETLVQQGVEGAIARSR